MLRNVIPVSDDVVVVGNDNVVADDEFVVDEGAVAVAGDAGVAVVA